MWTEGLDHPVVITCETSIFRFRPADLGLKLGTFGSRFRRGFAHALHGGGFAHWDPRRITVTRAIPCKVPASPRTTDS